MNARSGSPGSKDPTLSNAPTLAAQPRAVADHLTPSPVDAWQTEASGDAPLPRPRARTDGQDAGRRPQLATVIEQFTPAAVSDPVESADPFVAADAATTENLLRCWVRERGLTPHTTSDATLLLRLELPMSGTVVVAPVRHWSATGWHRFGVPTFDTGVSRVSPCPVDALTLAALLTREATGSVPSTVSVPPTGSVPPSSQPHESAHSGRPRTVSAETVDLLSLVADSVRQTAHFLAVRRAAPAPEAEVSPFLDAEQSLLLGHPLHPAAKSRGGLGDRESRRYAPELRGHFPLHWYAVDRSVLAADSAWTERGRTVSAERLATVLASPALTLPAGTVPLPLHPWQAREVAERQEVRQLLDQELLFDLGPAGDPWYPTSSVRTVHQPGTPAMLKLSLALRITNSRRENLRKELHRGVEVHRLLRTGLADEWRAAFPHRPGFDIVRDPAWLAVDAPEGGPVTGLDVVIRHNPFGPEDQARCLAALTSPRPWPDAPSHQLTSPLARLVRGLARRTGRPLAAVSAEWLLRYLHVVVQPVLWLDAVAGVALEAHQQNTLVLLDPDGWPQGGRYRDNQGYYLRTSRRAELCRRLPDLGEASDSFVDDTVTDERFAYYLGVNNVLGLIGAFGAEGLADETLLLAAFRRFLTAQRHAVGPAKVASPLPALLLDAPRLRCKANLLTRLHGLDELVGPVDTQSVYVTIANPLAA